MSAEIRHLPETLTIFLEGLSCCGKTTAMQAITSADVAKIYKEWPADLKNPPTEFFLERDEDKLRRARETDAPIKLIDRGYLSTLTFYTVFEEQRGISAYPVYRWFINELGGKLYRPDHYIFIDVPPEVSAERAVTSGRVIDENNMWLKFPERIEYWYDKLLAVFEPATAIHRIDGTKSVEQVTQELQDLLETLKGGKK